MAENRDQVTKVQDWPTPPDPDHAWKTLSLVNDWIRHGDAKIGVCLALTGGTSVLLFNLVDGHADPALPLIVLAALAALSLLGAAVCAVIGLVPQVRVGKRRESEAFTNLLFYRHIANGWVGEAGRFVGALGTLCADDQALTKHIGEQVHANAAVARRKYEWADRAIKALAAGIVLAALTALVRVVA